MTIETNRHMEDNQGIFNNVYCELLKNIESLSISVKLPPSSDKEKLAIGKQKVRIENDQLMIGSNKSISFEKIKPKALRRIALIDTNTLELSLSVETLPGDTLQSKLEKDTLSQEWKFLKDINCHSCHASLLPIVESDTQSQDRFDRTLPLPSEYWFELLDCWACHKEDYTTLPGQESGQILAKPRCVLVGSSYILLHPSDTLLESFQLVYTGRESVFKSRRWVSIHCKQCSSPLGEALMNSKSKEDSTDVQDVSIVKLFYYFVDLIGLKRHHQSFVPLLAHDILESARAHAAYQFVLCDKATGKPMVLLWLLNGTMDIGTIQKSDNDNLQSANSEPSCSRIKFDQAMKVLYIAIDDPGSSRETSQDRQTTISQWANNPKVEKWMFESSCIEELIATLDQNRMRLPNSKQTMKTFSVSFLHLF